MSRQRKIPKPIAERVRDCETHLHFLWEARAQYQTDRERYKQIAGELRVLVCGFMNNKPLLLDMMDRFGFSYEVQPPGPPFEKMPIILVGFLDDPVNRQLSEGLERSPGDKDVLAAVLAQQISLRVALPLRRYVDEGHAGFVRPYEYSFSMLTRAIAEQSGGAHEDEAVEEGVAAMGRVIIGSDPIHILTLVNFADVVLRAGMEFLGFMVANHGYQPKRFQVERRQ